MTAQFMSSSVSQEDISQPLSWPSEERPIPNAQLNKGKGKPEGHTENQDPSTSILQTSSEPLDAISYPPVNDDIEETRRVEENLRRWEVAERQRRKAARESSQKSAHPSYIGGTSRASLLWQGRKSKVPPIGGLGVHTALQSQDNTDTLPLRDINISPTHSTSRSDSEDSHIADPFANPPDSFSPFSDAHQPQQPEDIPVPYRNETPTSISIAFHADPPPSKLLALPPSWALPPIASPTPISQSNPTFVANNGHIPQDTRWWHEWLCGCGEGPDRGGDDQAGRTNPFE